MSKFAAFMAQNLATIENKKIFLSKRFVNPETGEIELWEIKAINSEENEELIRRSTVTVPVIGARGQTTREHDRSKYITMLAAASVVYPDLNDAELQDSFGVKTPEDLLKKMLYPSELGELIEQVSNLSDFDDLGEATEEAKN